MPNLDEHLLLRSGWRNALAWWVWLQENLSLGHLLLYAAVGAVLGLSLGVMTALALRRLGLLRRSHVFWRVLTACYFLYIPAVLFIAGAQAGLCVAGHRVFNDQMERYRSDIQHFAGNMLGDIRQNLQHALGGSADLSQASLNDLIDRSVDQAVAKVTASEQRTGARAMLNQLMLRAVNAPSARVALRHRVKAAIESVGMDSGESAALMNTRLDGLSNGQFVVDLMEARMRGYLRNFYVGVAIHASLWLLPPVLEIALACGLMRRRTSALAPEA
ncbi:hypothetical protein [Dyella telluris]|uniref:Uncharacterized protein n=1 Tax=Dyella telluris TaxID=2763498 RepID=A0A7G8Q6D1_9GAMM|nr:hypothetical protein [Dyella telluris]QNK02339.1 hypothetical protein H8F01_04095 [Dyella telluris]